MTVLNIEAFFWGDTVVSIFTMFYEPLYLCLICLEYLMFVIMNHCVQH